MKILIEIEVPEEIAEDYIADPDSHILDISNMYEIVLFKQREGTDGHSMDDYDVVLGEEGYLSDCEQTIIPDKGFTLIQEE